MDYRTAGVDVSLGHQFVQRIKAQVEQTHRPGVLSGLGGFAGLFEVPSGFKAPVLVAGTDGVGTKLKVAQLYNKHDTIGQDLVAMCANDVLTVGAEPLFFLDYVATGRLDPEVLTQVVEGIARGCQQAGCALLGGETAEMPGFYTLGEYDLAGFCVGVVEKARILDRSQVQVGDLLLGLPSTGLHSNGFSLVRQLVSDQEWQWTDQPPGLDQPLGEICLVPTPIYVADILAALQSGLMIHGMAHITGGGLPENVPRCLGSQQSAQIDPTTWESLPIFDWIQQQGQIERLEMFRTFNMGIGFVIVVPPDQVTPAQRVLPSSQVIGQVIEGSGEVLGLD